MPSTLNFGIFSDGLPEKKLQLVGMSILINHIKPWAGMSHNIVTPQVFIKDKYLN
jgi:hypothetical protein